MADSSHAGASAQRLLVVVAVLAIVAVASRLGCSNLPSSPAGPAPAEGRGELRAPLDAPTPRAQVDEPFGPLAGEGSLGGSAALTFLAVEEPSLATQTRWRLVSSEREEAIVGEASAAPWRVPSGHWRIESLSPPWKALEESVALEAGSSRVLWVVRTGVLSLRVVDPSGRAVTGASVSWSSAHTDPPPHESCNPDPPRSTDGDGRVELDCPRGVHGTVEVFAEGFLPLARAVHGPPPGTLTIELLPSQGDGAIARPVDAIHGGLVLGALLMKPPHVLSVAEGPLGEVLLPAGIAALGLLELHREAYLPTRFALGDLDEQGSVPLWPASTCTLAVVDAAGRPSPGAAVAIELGSGSWTQFTPLLDPLVRCDGGGLARTRLPRSLEVDLVAFAASGESARRRFQAGAPLEELTLRIDSRPPLQLSVVDVFQRPAAGAEATVHFGPQGRLQRVVQSQESGLLRIDGPDEVATIEVRASGLAPAQLRAVPGRDLPRCGRLVLELEPVHALDVRLVDPCGQPVPGVKLWAWRAADRAALRDHAELCGGRPTTHPGWALHPAAAPHAISDGEGSCRLRGLRAGPYELEVDLAAASSLDSLLEIPAFPVEVPRAELVWSIPRARRASIHAVEAGTGRTVRDVRVALPGMQWLHGSPSDSRWEGWIPAEEVVLSVAAPGYAAAEVAFHAGPEPASIDVPLAGGVVSRVRFRGEVLGLAAARYHVFREMTPGAGRGGGLVGIGGGTVELDSLAEASLTLPDEEGLWVGFGDGSGPWSFSPRELKWIPGGVHDVEVRRREWSH